MRDWKEFSFLALRRFGTMGQRSATSCRSGISVFGSTKFKDLLWPSRAVPTLPVAPADDMEALSFRYDTSVLSKSFFDPLVLSVRESSKR